MLRNAASLVQPIAPAGTEMACAYLNLDYELWNWDNIFKPEYFFMKNLAAHSLRFLEPRIGFSKSIRVQIVTKDD